jgi:RNA polymerase sigma-70 factor (ECF subfamily)
MHGKELTPSEDLTDQIEKAYSEWSQPLSRFALRLAANREDAEDIVVETFVEAYRHWSDFKGSGSRQSWLYGIAINRHRMMRRKVKFGSVPLKDELHSTRHDGTQMIAIEQEIAKLPIKQREAFLLVKSEGLTAREAAIVLRRPMGTVLFEVHQATKALRNALADEMISVQLSSVCGVEL